MEFIFSFKEILYSGDPLVRTWPLVGSDILPVTLCALYVFFVKKLGPILMKDRKPFDLRGIMIVYNFSIVFTYVGALLTLVYVFSTTDCYEKICINNVLSEDDCTYAVACAGWVFYAVKYVEFLDTVFFILRKKDHLITNLHVIHHTILPLMFWIGARSETSGFQLIPASINALVHVVMYSYYALAAMGPEMQRRLWWKVYLTRLQMAQFIIAILVVFVSVHIFGCATTPHCVFLDIFGAVLFFILFCDFYSKRYRKAPAANDAVKRK